jgi:hypothetical protein
MTTAKRLTNNVLHELRESALCEEGTTPTITAHPSGRSTIRYEFKDGSAIIIMPIVHIIMPIVTAVTDAITIRIESGH